MFFPCGVVASQGRSLSSPNACTSRVPWIVDVLFIAVLLAGCEPVQSLNAFYEDKDVIFDSSLAGTWKVKGDGESEQMELSFAQSVRDADAYDVALSIHSDKPGEDKPQEGSVTFSGHLFQAGDSKYLDLYPVKYTAKWGSRTISFDAKDNLFGAPAHTVYLVRQEGNELRLAFLDDDYVKAFVEKNDLPLTVRDSKNFVLSGKSEDLKAGLLMRAEKEGLLDHDGIELARPE
jgi:hypothetical protein